MYQTIGERIDVAGVYTQGRFQPRQFQWRSRVLPVQAITAVHNVKDGTVRKRRFAVMSQGQLYLLEFNREQETWTLDQTWMEG